MPSAGRLGSLIAVALSGFAIGWLVAFARSMMTARSGSIDYTPPTPAVGPRAVPPPQLVPMIDLVAITARR